MDRAAIDTANYISEESKTVKDALEILRKRFGERDLTVDRLVGIVDTYVGMSADTSEEAELALAELERLARLGAAVEAMPKGTFLAHDDIDGTWGITSFCWGSVPQEVNNGLATPMEALRQKR